MPQIGLEPGRGKTHDVDPEAHLKDLIVNAEKTPEDLELISAALMTMTVNWDSREPQEIEALSREMSLFEFVAGMDVCREGDDGSYFFIIQSGNFEVSVNGEVVAVMQRGKSFGEIALMHNTPRSATITCASSNGSVWGVKRQQFRDVLIQLSARNFAERRKFLEQVKILDILTEAQKTMITNMLIEENFETDHPIIQQGQKGDVLFIIKSGQCKIFIGDQWIRDLGPGEYFGERALLYDEVRSATVKTEGPVTVLSIGRMKLASVLGNLQHVLFRNMMVIAVRSSETFNQFTVEQVDSILQAVIVKDYPENYTILDGEMRAKDVRFLIVLEGTILISKDNFPIMTVGRGQPFGEEYILNPSLSFHHRVDSIEPTKLALITTNVFDMCLGSSDMQKTLEHNTKKRIMQKIYIFRYLTGQQYDVLINNFKSVTLRKGDPVFRQGDTGTEFYIIKEGEVEIVLDNVPGTDGPFGKGKRIRTSGKHDYFGERALLYDEPRSASIYTTSDTIELWAIEKPIFQSVLQGPMLKHLEERIEMQNTRIAFKDLVNVSIIGRGTYGVVREVYVKSNPKQRYALKANSRYHTMLKGLTKLVSIERECMAECDHPFIIKLVKCYKSEKYLYFLQELSKGGELYDGIRKIGLCTKSQTTFYVASIIAAMEYIHERGIVFRDLKPENILLDEHGYIKIIDFGCAKKLQAQRTYTMLGTPHYMAPEIILGKGYGLSVDIWSIGVTMYEMFCGTLPFELEDISDSDQLDVFRHILTAKLTFPLPESPNFDNDQDMQLLTKRFLCRIPEVRIGCGMKGYKEIKDHPFFTGFDFDKLLTREYDVPLLPEIQLSPPVEGGSCEADNAGLEDISCPSVADIDPFSSDWDSGFEWIPTD
eukprot:GHVH01012552.1.p1 GENE.GHVH01012552.1~~GHVH01012552.1.p1  ORF type:complete len:880 (-),score=162.05 GHVH01012552.1:121-2760(-)